jgi:hypothetical protein
MAYMADDSSLKAEDFPLYQLLVRLNGPGVERATADFNAAARGGDDEKYSFALGIQTVAANVPWQDIPDCSPEIMQKTLRSCLTVFNALAERGHASAAFMVRDFAARGLGL